MGGSSQNWSDSANWDPTGVPGPDDSATIAASGTSFPVYGATDVCNLDLDGAVALTTSGNIEVSSSLNRNGGDGSHGPGIIEGGITDFAVTISGMVQHKSEAPGITPMVSKGSLTIAGGSNVTVDCGDANLVVTGTAQIGGPGFGTELDSNCGDENDFNGQLVDQGSVTLNGDVTSKNLDVNIAPAESLDVGGHTWQMSDSEGDELAGWRAGHE